MTVALAVSCDGFSELEYCFLTSANSEGGVKFPPQVHAHAMTNERPWSCWFSWL
eukprot:CAMPEP_0171105638 /NCGR_PEP_ID=MMETSP0766_2-20121228/63129_1 /TAXON_ID=439317 /ORGANISM="Gambierdiscus australes, Strain CAWD 149" /LENGTH=53 /DNA_ID=CAMNT_0011566551 /DNA_START=32 /DNA_END=189 /DNA_ORIENTATION=-